MGDCGTLLSSRPPHVPFVEDCGTGYAKHDNQNWVGAPLGSLACAPFKESQEVFREFHFPGQLPARSRCFIMTIKAM